MNKTTNARDDSNDLVKAIRQFLADARYIIDKVDEFELSLKLARQRDHQQHDTHTQGREELTLWQRSL